MENDLAITPELVRQLKKALEAHRRAAQEHEEKAQAIAMMIRGASVLDPDAILEAESPKAEVHDGDTASGQDLGEQSIPNTIMRLLSSADRSMTKLGLRQRLVESGIAPERLGRNFSYFYTSLKRLEKAGKIKKRGRLYRSAS